METTILKTALEKYHKSEKSTIDVIGLLSVLKDSMPVESKIYTNDIFKEITSEVIGLSTESSSRKQKIMETSTKKAITEYMIGYLSDIESNIINNSKTKLRLQQKIKKMINDYLKTGYFKNITIVTVTDDLMDSVYANDYSLSYFIKTFLQEHNIDIKYINNFIESYKETIDSVNITELKIAFRKTIIEGKSDDDVFCDMWLYLKKITGNNICFKIFNSFNEFKVRKKDTITTFITPLLHSNKIYSLTDTNKYKKVHFENEEYFVGTIKTFEDNDTKFERFITKLRAYDFKNEAELLHIYISSNLDLINKNLINDKFSTLPEPFYTELLELNNNKFRQTTIGYIILSEPCTDIYESDGSLNFVIKMLVESIYKMSEILLINEYEFQEFQKEMLISLQEVSQLRDTETAYHQDRVTIYTKILAEAILKKKENNQLDLMVVSNNLPIDSDYFIIDKEYIRDLVYGASLHDLGKVGIEDSILKSPNKLTEIEYNNMKKHTTYGNERLSSIVKISRKKSFLTLAAGLAENHHERWDGTGYPNGKKEQEIPLSARILTIADVYDALRIKRPYKRNYTHEEACEYIKNAKNKQFDPVIVDIFLENAKKFKESFDSF